MTPPGRHHLRERDGLHLASTPVGRREAMVALGCALITSCSPLRRTASDHKLNLAQLEAGNGGRLGIAAFDRSDGGSVAWRGGERFAFCSTFKPFLATAMMQRVEQGLDRLDRPVAVEKGDLLPNAPVTGPAAGSTLTLAELAQAAVEVSDNPAANLLIRELGGLGAWRGWYRRIGDRSTRVDRPEVELNVVRHGDPRDTTTPMQTVANLRHIFERPALNPVHRALILKWMIETPTGPRRIKAAAPQGSIVAHKTGSADDYGHTNDIGIIWLNGRPDRPIYVAAYYNESGVPAGSERDDVLAAGVRAALSALGVV